MRALTIQPGLAHSLRLDEIDEPDPVDGSILVECLAVGVCGTDFELVSGSYGWAPPNRSRLVIGHESLGRVLDAPPTTGFAVGDLIVGIVRHPDPVPCPNCSAGEWDMCRNGLYTERGIKERDGFASERFRIEPNFAVKVSKRLGMSGVLLEPASVVAKAWAHIDKIGHRTLWNPQKVLVTGAGPVGLLAAMLAKQRGLDVHVLDRFQTGPKPGLVAELGGKYHTGDIRSLGFTPDVIVECTGAESVIAEALGATSRGGIICLAGVTTGGHVMNFDMGRFNRSLVLENDVVFGSVNANRSHYAMAAEALAACDINWLQGIVTRQVPLERWREAFERHADDVKTTIQFKEG